MVPPALVLDLLSLMTELRLGISLEICFELSLAARAAEVIRYAFIVNRNVRLLAVELAPTHRVFVNRLLSVLFARLQSAPTRIGCLVVPRRHGLGCARRALLGCLTMKVIV